MKWIAPESSQVFSENGKLLNANGRYQKHFRDLEGLYEDEESFSRMFPEWSEKVVYQVEDHRASEQPGDLIYGTTVMMPGKVGNEFFMTRGHQHQKAECAETYFGLSGEGILLLESHDGDVEVREIRAGIMVYVPPYCIHRSVNTGNTDLVFLFNYPSDAGQDYEIIERNRGMRKRVVTDGTNGWELKDNEDSVKFS